MNKFNRDDSQCTAGQLRAREARWGTKTVVLPPAVKFAYVRPSRWQRIKWWWSTPPMFTRFERLKGRLREWGWL